VAYDKAAGRVENYDLNFQALAFGHADFMDLGGLEPESTHDMIGQLTICVHGGV
jgi:hypothetical protein